MNVHAIWTTCWTHDLKLPRTRASKLHSIYYVPRFHYLTDCKSLTPFNADRQRYKATAGNFNAPSPPKKQFSKTLSKSKDSTTSTLNRNLKNRYDGTAKRLRSLPSQNLHKNTHTPHTHTQSKLQFVQHFFFSYASCCDHYHYRYDCCSHLSQLVPTQQQKGPLWLDPISVLLYPNNPSPGEQTPHNTTRNSQAKKDEVEGEGEGEQQQQQQQQNETWRREKTAPTLEVEKVNPDADRKHRAKLDDDERTRRKNDEEDHHDERTTKNTTTTKERRRTPPRRKNDEEHHHDERTTKNTTTTKRRRRRPRQKRLASFA